MATQIFVNLAVKDLKRSIEFFTAMGYTFNKQATDETGTRMMVADDISVMLLTEQKFMMFSPKPPCDTAKNNEVLLCLSCGSRDAVDEMVSKAVAAGGTTYSEPQDYGFMYSHGYQDPDGHVWGLLWFDPAAAVPDQPEGSVKDEVG